MTQQNNYFIWVLWVFCSSSLAAPILDNGSYWQCTTKDSIKKIWTAKNTFQKAALNQAFASCKKESTVPSTCKTSESSCEGFNMGTSSSNKPMWRCTALDEAAEAYRSTVYSQRDDAALGAKAFCRNKSSVPDTCYINLVTCVNVKVADDR